MNWFKGCHFNQDIITVAVGYYFRFNFSYRDVVEIMADRGVSAHHTTIMRWVHHYGAIFQMLWRRHNNPLHKADGLMKPTLRLMVAGTICIVQLTIKV